ncbi:MAG: type II toxin-antitoxin system RelE family toxin [Candidatus Syntropharchaeia archaeon]
MAERLAKAIKRLSDYPYFGKPLPYDYSGLRSLHIGKHRIIYEIDEKNKEIWLIDVGHREKIY